MRKENIVVLSGAGLSAESGLRTFRDDDGLREDYDVMDVCSIEGWRKNRAKVMGFYDLRRSELVKAKPNKCHEYLASLEKRFGDKFINMTQNVDDLLERAGCDKVVHLHGKLRELRCEQCGCEFDIGFRAANSDDVCPKCSSKKVRHNVVMFGEEAPNYKYINQYLESAKLFIVIGTSGQVLNISDMAKVAEKSIYVNLNREHRHGMFGLLDGYIDEDFDLFLNMKATEAVSRLDEIIQETVI